MGVLEDLSVPCPNTNTDRSVKATTSYPAEVHKGICYLYDSLFLSCVIQRSHVHGLTSAPGDLCHSSNDGV